MQVTDKYIKTDSSPSRVCLACSLASKKQAHACDNPEGLRAEPDIKKTFVNGGSYKRHSTSQGSLRNDQVQNSPRHYMNIKAMLLGTIRNDNFIF